jgi:hypothetical protein
MQRLSNVTLGIALSIFVGAASLSLLAAAWLMATHLLNGPARWVAPAWLLVILFTLGSRDPALAQAVSTGTFAVVEERISDSNGQSRVLYSIATTFDSVPPPVRSTPSRLKPAIQTTPTWPEPEPMPWEQAAGTTVPRAFYIIATSPMVHLHKPVPGWITIRP